ncbi:UDP-glucose/GDP-mannose dehydrogenase family protein [Paramuribaculum intestinale]|uniref:UDP-glucose 6-dehydrogenase n=2 Tax=Paramuribaculum intestinale TaxID=2094151 RepID=A0A2V1IY96_9BACT|nr:UDP-glucose/GDP-mannose dehydrogenase family protein [Paramuribaculum intestinale]PWB08430.1 UDP-glucose/GDP-mannose dehydrogenase family protein [Paramuribaculum intestinale]PWB12599.1 UDP-glucose/GDP-mannose dehydrogenase family protein [Paramuribaculum intestinale]ROS92513.1 UDP-glucose/GDP-mannose dehydrogenase family protein [Muribaculaceae bacterium Isolate-043 (Harlan)]WLT42140.1 UDP-glucose/GDP-mannose dehydrogenase family protein [Paramuribaculum intestinale]
MKIAIVGTGYVGLVSGACFAEMGTDVTCVDIDKAKIESLRQGIIPIYEPGLDELVRRNVRDGRLHFTTSLEEVINDVEAVFSAVGTPPDDDGSADLTAVKAVARTFGRHIDRQAILVTKSTVPVGTSEIIRGIINEELDRRGVNVDFELASNPEFLKEGAAIKDFMSPDRVVIGVDGPRSREVMERLYRPFLLQNFRVMFMDIPSAEMAKYAANAMLATRISFINDIANLCELTGADVSQVRRAIGADTRIGNKFLYPGCGYGGSCFPKDVQALIRTGEQLGYPMRVIQAVEAVNDEQKHIPFRKLRKALGRLEGRRIALWGLAFKPETDDMRLAPSLTLIEDLLGDGATVCVFDPVAMDECRRRLSDKVDYATDMYAACIDADALCVLTEWKQFRLPSWPAVARLMNGETVIDGRNIYSPDDLAAAGLKVHAIGRP